jgi:hypothetical protein
MIISGAGGAVECSVIARDAPLPVPAEGVAEDHRCGWEICFQIVST